MCLKQKQEIQVRCQEEMLFSEHNEALVAQRSFKWLIPEGNQGQVGWDLGQSDLVEGVHVHSIWTIGTG